MLGLRGCGLGGGGAAVGGEAAVMLLAVGGEAAVMLLADLTEIKDQTAAATVDLPLQAQAELLHLQE
mgnify:CR=1 FL=1